MRNKTIKKLNTFLANLNLKREIYESLSKMFLSKVFMSTKHFMLPVTMYLEVPKFVLFHQSFLNSSPNFNSMAGSRSFSDL